jgi:MOSC domain-containing protein YiiM
LLFAEPRRERGRVTAGEHCFAAAKLRARKYARADWAEINSTTGAVTSCNVPTEAGKRICPGPARRRCTSSRFPRPDSFRWIFTPRSGTGHRDGQNVIEPRVVSLNVGPIRSIEWEGEVVTTGIWKFPVEGRVALRGVNLVGDDQADRTVHGGPDKAVYAYAREDYAYWREAEGMETSDGLFGENLTVVGLQLSDSVVGERWNVGSTVLEVAQPRLPCYKLGIRVGDSRFLKRFLIAGRTGAYLRIVQEGDVGTGDVIHVASKPVHGVTLGVMVAALRDSAKAAMLRDVPYLPEFWREVAWDR